MSEFKLLSHIDVEQSISLGEDGLTLSLLKWKNICEAIKSIKYEEDIEAIVYNSREVCGLCYKYKYCHQCLFKDPCYIKGPIKDACDAILDWQKKQNKRNQNKALKKSISVLVELVKYCDTIDYSKIKKGDLIRVDFEKRARE